MFEAMFDADKLKNKATREALSSALADLTGHIDEIEEALEIADDGELDSDGREVGRETVAVELEELFTEFAALERISERLR